MLSTLKSADWFIFQPDFPFSRFRVLTLLTTTFVFQTVDRQRSVSYKPQNHQLVEPSLCNLLLHYPRRAIY